MSCQPTTKKSTDNIGSAYNARVIESAGDLYSEFSDKGIPLFFNIAEMRMNEHKTIRIILLGEKLNSGIEIGVTPINTFNIKKDSTTYQYLVALPSSDADSITPEVYQTEHITLFNTIESWFVSHCDIGQCHDISWSNASKVITQ